MILQENDYVIGKMIYNFGTKKEYEKRLVGRIKRMHTGWRNSQYEVTFLRKESIMSADGDEQWHFVYSTFEERRLLDPNKIVPKVTCEKATRGKIVFF